MKKIVAKFCSGCVALVVMVYPVSASAFMCKALPAAGLGVDAGGQVLVVVEGTSIIKICNLNADQGGVTKEACAAWYSSLLTWREAGKTGWLYFDPSTVSNVTNCTQLAPWQLNVPYYLEAG